MSSRREQQRWLSARNIGTQPIPAYGICGILPSDGDGFRAVESENGSLVYRVQTPNDEIVAAENPGLLFVNSPTSILPGKTGRVTQDWPAQVLHNGRYDVLPNGTGCGPISGEPCVWAGRGPFVCLSHDPSLPAVRGGMHTVLISPGTARMTIGETRIGGGVIDPEELLRFSDLEVAPSWSDNAVAVTSEAIGTPLIYSATTKRLGYYGGWDDDLYATLTAFEVKRSGLYWFSFSATITSVFIQATGEVDWVNSTEGYKLRATLVKRAAQTDENAEAPAFIDTDLTGWRTYTRDTISFNYDAGEYDFTQDAVEPKENLAFSGLIILEKGEQIAIRNRSSIVPCVMSFSDARWSMYRVAELSTLTRMVSPDSAAATAPIRS